jgi:hypothetical protein
MMLSASRPNRRERKPRAHAISAPPSAASVAPGPTRTLAPALAFLAVVATALPGIGCAPPPTPRSDGGRDGGPGDASGSDGALTGGLQINEICPDDDGFQIDELGQVDDWIELRNGGPSAIDLAGFALGDGGRGHRLPARRLGPGETALFWADGSPEQGPAHLDFKLAARGGRVELRDLAGALTDAVDYPALDTNVALARFPDGAATLSACRYATPGRPNGARCAPPPPAELPVEVRFAEFSWPPGFGQPAGPLVITEVSLRPSGFVEVANLGNAPVALGDFALRLSRMEADSAWPGPRDGVEVPWPHAGSMIPGERLMIPIDATTLSNVFGAATPTPALEGAFSVFTRAGAVVNRLDFIALPEGAALALASDDAGAPLAYRLCAATTPGAANSRCNPLPARAVGDRVRQLLTPADVAALGEGGTELDSVATKVVVDLLAGDTVHFLAARQWSLHYTFVRERIYRQPHLDRCDPLQASQFEAAWREFSDREYYQTTGRRFLLGTLVRYGGSGVQTLEFDRSDEITAEQMRRAFFAVAARTPRPSAWAVRAQGRQVAALKAIEGTLPVLEPNAPFRGLTFQPITPGIGFGMLRFVPAAELGRARLGQDVIVVTDDVPNDVPLVGGLVTEAFQTPLSHVGVLTRNRGTPNMALLAGRQDSRLAPLFEKLVRLQVDGGGFTAREATAAEAQTFWDSRRPRGPKVVPRLDTSVRGWQDLRSHGLASLPSVGAKAAQLAELMRVQSTEADCPGPVPVPPAVFAVPLVHYLEHFERSGARRLLDSGRARPDFASDVQVRVAVLAQVRQAILDHPVDPALLGQIEGAARAAFGQTRFRLRSSSNTEDLPDFSGAGLYTSVSAALDDPERPLAGGLREVWASLWGDRAYDERELGNVDQSQVAMGVLVHQAYNGVERANGVAVSRDIVNPIYASSHYLNAQAGEASVTNPAPGVVSESMTFEWWKTPPATYLSRSSLSMTPVLQPAEIARISCLMRAVHTHFAPRIDPTGANRWFAMESEWKLIGAARTLVIKQARPYSFGPVEIPADCREL